MTCEDKGERPDGARHHVERDLVAGVPDALPGVVGVAVIVRLPDVHEGGVVPQRQ